MKKLAAILTLCIIFSIFCVVAMADNTSNYVDNDIYNGTRFRDGECADPWVTYHDGYYYATRTGATKVPVYKAATLEGLFKVPTNDSIVYNSSLDETVTTLFGSGATINGTWSPEIHYFSEEDFPGNSGWYMYLALKQNYDDPTGGSSRLRMVVLKSTGDDATDIFGHPVSLAENQSEPLRDSDGSIHDTWGCGQTILRITEGEYAGIYTMWVEEDGRGTADFHQIIRIAKLKTPWQLDSDVCTITTPTQDWEMSGGYAPTEKYPEKWLPDVVEGATPVYGKNGEIFLVYSGSGYWTGGNYALGQLSWTGGDPLDQNSWVKLGTDKNPIFDAKNTSYASGAGHSCFIQDKDGNGFAVYHVYFTSHGDAGEKRRACIEPYYIDYTEPNGAGYGVVHIGVNDNGAPADWYNTVVEVTSHSGEYLSKPLASGGYDDQWQINQLVMQDSLADGFTIFRKASGEDYYTYLDTTTDTIYEDWDVSDGETYSYHIYSYREEEISPDCAEVEVEIPLEVAAPSISTGTTPKGKLGIKVTAMGDCDTLTVYRADTPNGAYEEIESSNYGFSTGFSFIFVDTAADEGNTYYYKAIAQNGNWLSDYSNTLEVYYPITSIPAPSLSSSSQTCTEVTLNFSGDIEYDSFIIYRGSMITDLAEYATTSETSYTVTDMKIGQAYVYQVVGVKDGIESDGSAVHSITLNHFAYEVAAKDATCTEDGYESYSYCLKCKETLIEKVIVPAKGHSYEVIEEKIPATETSEGKTAVEKCSVCGDTRGGEVIPMLNPGSGDVNGDEKVTLGDVLLAFKTGSSEADMDGDGRITLYDILLLIKMILNG